MLFLPQILFRSPIDSCTTNALQKNVFDEALYLSSPVLHNEHQKELTNPKKDTKELKKLNVSLYKYQTRAKYRPTPFGLFAGLSVGFWEEKNNIVFDSDLNNALHRKTRLDMNVLCSIAQELIKKDFIKPHLMFFPNSSIYKIGKSYRYVEYYYAQNRRFHKINKVDFSEYLQRILIACKSGLTHQQLTLLLINDDIEESEASDFVNELITSQILVNQLEPTVTGDDFFEVLMSNLNGINSLNKSNELSHIIQGLKVTDTSIKKLDEKIINQIDAYKLIHQQLKNILPELTETNLFQTDLYKKTINKGVNSEIQLQLKNTIEFLNKISPKSPNINLVEFKKKFAERYEDYEIPLLLALDSEAGIGYPTRDINGVNELIEDIYLLGDTTNDSDIKWNPLQTHLLKLITKSIKQHKNVIVISENDFDNINYSENDLPTTLSVMFKVLDTNNNKIAISGIGGSSAINLLGRFAGGNKELNLLVNTIAEYEQEQNPNKILAEIVHLPENRTGNILARPSFRPYEIPYLAKSTVEDSFQIKMEDLTIKIMGNKIILFDKRLQREIIPRLGNAHNFNFNSLPVYNFLCDLQTQYFSKTHIGFNWGVLANQFDFLPRVEFQNTVLTSAKWQLRKKDLEVFKDKKKSDIEKHSLFFELKKRIELPNKFLIADGDNELLIDCNNPIAIDAFIDCIKNRIDLVLEEYLFEDEHSLIKDSNGNSFTNECIAIVLNENISKEQINIISAKPFLNQQTFSIGSEWLYYKIYCGAKTADHILTEKIKHITEILLDKNIIDKWFFIRYADPDVHLRFRLHISNLDKYGEILQLINKEFDPLLNQHLISKIQTDTYKRELERYGDNSMELVESLFYTDSVFVTNMLDMLDAESGVTIRWQMALRSVEEFLNDFKFTAEDKFQFISGLSTSFFNEHGGKKELRVTLDNKFRNFRPQIEDVLNFNSDESKEYYPIIELLNVRSKQNKKIIEEICMLNTNKELQLTINDLLASLLHMNLDRLFMGRNRTNEFVVYDLLARYYKSDLARSKSLSKKETILI